MSPAEVDAWRARAAAYDAHEAASEQRLAAKRRTWCEARGLPDPAEYARAHPAQAERDRQRAEAERNACPYS